MLRIWFLTTLFFTFLSPLFSQEPYFRNYRVGDGLPSDDVHFSFQDSKGWMWFATETGISRFDGYRFENFTVADGLPDNECFGIFEDSRSRIWFLTANGDPGYYLNGQIYNHLNDSSLGILYDSLHAHPKLGYMGTIFEDNEKNIWIGFRWAGYMVYEHDGGVRYANKKRANLSQNLAIRHFWQNSKGEILTLSTRGTYRLSGNFKMELLDSIPRTGFFPFRTCTFGNDRIIAVDEADIYSIDRETGRVVHRQPVTGVAERTIFIREYEGKLRFGSYEGAGTLSWTGTEWERGNFYLPGKIVSSIHEDHEGNYWMTTQKDGVFFTPSFRILSYFPQGKNGSNFVSNIARLEDGNLFLGMDDLGFCLFDGESFDCRTFTSNIPVGRGRMRDIYPCGPDERWYINENILIHEKNGKIGKYAIASVCFAIREDGMCMIGTSSGLIICPKSALDLFLDIHLRENDAVQRWGVLLEYLVSQDKIRKLVKENGRNYWAGGVSGLYKIRGNKMELISPKYNLPEKQVEALAPDGKGGVWIGYFGEGVWHLSADGTTQHWSTASGMSSDFIHCIVPYQDDRILVGTSRGLNIIRHKGSGARQVTVLGTENGLILNEINDILIDGDQVWISSANGVTRLYSDVLDPHTAKLPVRITSFSANDSVYPLDEMITLQPGRQKISIRFVGLSYRYNKQLQYRYKMMGLDTAWQYTDLNRLEFGSLPPGEFEFILQAGFPNGEWSSDQPRLRFQIPPTLWQQTWFLLLLILMGFGGITGIFLLRVRAVRARAKLKQKAEENKQTALRSQMNPHFIFNSLNSLQRFILRNDTDSAYDYTAKFGKLVRQILEHSKHQKIALGEDLQTLELYLELEAIRFDHQFHWEIKVSPDISPSMVKLPPTLIQPYVENSLWHGLMPKEGEKRLEIEIYRNGDQLLVEIRDNGIGRKASEKINEKRIRVGKSTGMEVTRQRILSLYKRKPEQDPVRVTDGPNSEGTVVKLRIPL